VGVILIEIAMKSILIFSFLSLVSPLSFAGDELAGKTIKNVIVNIETGIHFKINESHANGQGCNSNSWFKLRTGSVYEKEAYSMLLAYQAQSKPITFYVSGCTGGFPSVTYIYSS
jgi:hypothetical protein